MAIQKSFKVIYFSVNVKTIPTYMTTIPQHYRQTDGRAEGQTTWLGNNELRYAMLRAVITQKNCPF